MRSRIPFTFSAVLAIGALLTLGALSASADVPPQMTVQGKLTNSIGKPSAPGFKLFTFKIFDAQSGGSEIWPAGPGETITVKTDSLGLWTAQLGTVIPLTDPVFAGIDRWLEITVNDGVNPPETLSRLKLNTNPFAFRSATSQKADTALSGGGWVHEGTVVRLDNAADSVGIGTDSPDANLHVIGTLHASDKANFGPNNANPGAYAFVAGSANTAGGHYSTVGGGELNVAAATLSTIGGGNMNRVSNEYGTIGGGFENTVTGFVGTIAGGRSNVASNVYGTVGGGYHNHARGAYSVVAGGGGETDADSNIASGDFSTVSGGRANVADGQGASVGGGQQNYAGNIDEPSTVAGGRGNVANNSGVTIGGGFLNNASGNMAAIVGGERNTVSGRFAFVGGGIYNKARGVASVLVGGGSYPSAEDSNAVVGDYSVIVGGRGNIASGGSGFIGGGGYNRARGLYSVIAGGGGGALADSNSASGDYSAVGGGARNLASGEYSTVSGGRGNTASGGSSVVSGGYNLASAGSSTVCGGAYDTASGIGSIVLGGHYNTASGHYSLAAGCGATAVHPGAFVWSDNTASDFTSVADNEFAARAVGGVRFVTAIDINTGAPVAGVQLAPGGGSWSSISDRNAKANIAPVDGPDLLAKLARIPVATWNYKSQDPSIRHIGPMAQDFYAAFGVGEDDKHITTIDADGVALAAIQALYESNRELVQKIAELQKQIETLKAQAK